MLTTTAIQFGWTKMVEVQRVWDDGNGRSDGAAHGDTWIMDVDLTTGRKYFRDPRVLDRDHLIMSQIYVLYLSHSMVPTPVFLEQGNCCGSSHLGSIISAPTHLRLVEPEQLCPITTLWMLQDV